MARALRRAQLPFRHDTFTHISQASTRKKGATRSNGRQIRAYDYVNQPYEKVPDALHEVSEDLLRHATRAAASRARSVASGPSVNIGGVEVTWPPT